MSDFERFAELVGTDFELNTPEGPATIRLDQCRTYGPDDRSSFVLSFSGTSGGSLGQGSHQVISPPFGDDSLFLVPVGPDEYEAVFNRQPPPLTGTSLTTPAEVERHE